MHMEMGVTPAQDSPSAVLLMPGLREGLGAHDKVPSAQCWGCGESWAGTGGMCRWPWAGSPICIPCPEDEALATPHSQSGRKCLWFQAVVRDKTYQADPGPKAQSATRLLHPWDSPGSNTGEGCHFLLQCTQVKSESEVTQLCPTPIRVKLCSQNTDFFCSSILDSLKLCGAFVVSCSLLA